MDIYTHFNTNQFEYVSTRLEGVSQRLAPPVYHTSFLGMSFKVGALLNQGANVNMEGGEYSNALQAISFEGHNKIVETVLARGANVRNCKGSIFLSGNLAAMLVQPVSLAL